MPDQACANGLKLDDIPQDLQEISTTERRIISLRLPFFEYTCYAEIRSTLQGKWAPSECSNNIKSSYRHVTLHASAITDTSSQTEKET